MSTTDRPVVTTTAHNTVDTYKQVLPSQPLQPGPHNHGDCTLEVNHQDCTLEAINRNNASGLQVDLRGRQDTDQQAMGSAPQGSGLEDAAELYPSKVLLLLLLKRIGKWWNGLSRRTKVKVWLLVLIIAVLLVIIIVPSVTYSQDNSYYSY